MKLRPLGACALFGGLVSFSSFAAAQSSDAQPVDEQAAVAPRNVDGVEFSPGKGLTAVSSDGDFSLSIGFRNQFRLTLEQKRPEGPDPDGTMALAVRRSRFALKGNAFGKHTKYELQLDLAPQGVNSGADGTPTTSPLLDAYVKFEQVRDLSLRVGQYKSPYLREHVMSDGKLELVDRSLLNSRFTIDRDIGLDVYSSDLFGLDKMLRYNLGVYAGEGRNAFQQSSLGMLYVARVEALPLGAFDDYSEGDFERSAPRLSVGAAYAYHSRAERTGGTRGSAFADQGTADYKLMTGDLMFKAVGLTLLATVAWRDGTRDPGGATDEATGTPFPTTPALNGWGFSGQAGYLFPHTGVGLAGRYSMLRKRGDDSGMVDENEVGGGASYFFAQHLLKLQADAIRVWTEEAGFKHGTDQIRVQLQLSI